MVIIQGPALPGLSAALVYGDDDVGVAWPGHLAIALGWHGRMVGMGMVDPNNLQALLPCFAHGSQQICRSYPVAARFIQICCQGLGWGSVRQPIHRQINHRIRSIDSGCPGIVKGLHRHHDFFWGGSLQGPVPSHQEATALLWISTFGVVQDGLELVWIKI